MSKSIIKQAIAATIFSSASLAAATSYAAEVNVGTGTISKVRNYSNVHNYGERFVVDMTGVNACNGKTSFAIDTRDGKNSHVVKSLLAAYLAGKSVELAVDDSATTAGGRCQIRGATVKD